MNTRTIKLKNQEFLRRALYIALATLIPTTIAAQEDAFTLDAVEEKTPLDPEAVRALTEVQSEIEIGVGSVSEDSFKFGKYTGLEREGIYGVLNIDLRERGPYDGDNAGYWNLNGSDLGLRSRSLKYEQGTQGNYRMFFEYDQLPTFRSDSAQTIFDGVGGTHLTLPAGWVPGANTAGMTQLLPNLQDVNIEHERRRIGVGFDKELGDGWDFTTSYRRETKEGIKTVGAVIGNSGGNPRAVIIPEPIEYVTQQFDVTLGYADSRKQFQFGYYLSLFRDENQSLTWQNPYSAIAGWDASAGFPTGEGRLHLPPDNQFHQITASGGYSLTEHTRLTADIALGRMMQDDEFLPYTVNPTLAASITQPLPRDSLDGKIDTLLVNLRVAARPTPKFHWNAGLRHDDRNNQTPRNEYVYIGGDSQTQNTAATSDRRRFNEPYSYTEDQVRVDAGYQIFQRTEVTAGYERSKTERTFSERELATENTYRLGFKSNLSEVLNGGVRLARADRHGSTYVGEEPFLSSYSPGYTSTVPGGWENHPDLRKYFLADRARDTVTLFTTYLPMELLTVGLSANYVKDNYENSEMGLTESRNTSYTLDMNYLISETLTTYAFYTYERFRSDQDGRQFNPLAPGKLVQAADPTRDWFVSHHDRIDTFGLGAKKTLIENKLDVGADYVHSDSRAEIDVTTGTTLTAAHLPSIDTRLNSLSLYGKYKLKTHVSVKARYSIEYYKSRDWSVDNVDPDTLANVITLGENSPDYTVHVFTLSVAYRF